LRSNDEVASGMLMFPSLSLSSWFVLELSIWLGIRDRVRRGRLKSREKEWEEQGGGGYKRRTQLSNWCYCRCKIHNTPTLTSKNQHKQCHKTKHHHASTEFHQSRHSSGNDTTRC
jgi:Mg2+/citrate symporter